MSSAATWWARCGWPWPWPVCVPARHARAHVGWEAAPEPWAPGSHSGSDPDSDPTDPVFVHRAREDEQQVRQPVQVAHDLRVALRADGDRASLGAAADGAADVQVRGGGRAAGDHERAQRRKRRVDLVAGPLQPLGVLRGHAQPGDPRHRPRPRPHPVRRLRRGAGTDRSAPRSSRSFCTRASHAAIRSGRPGWAAPRRASRSARRPSRRPRRGGAAWRRGSCLPDASRRRRRAWCRCGSD